MRRNTIIEIKKTLDKYLPMRAKKMMTNENGKIKISDEERENKRLRELLQKAVNQEKAPEELREKIRKMIRR